MQTAPHPILLLMLAAGILGLVAIGVALRLGAGKYSRAFAVVAALPALTMLGLFYSLAIHMHRSLGRWPSSIGMDGFPASLTIHANIAAGYFSILLLVGIFVWPVVFLLCLFVRRWRRCLYYLGVYALACFVCFGAMLLGPSPFLYWWWD